MIAEAEIRSDYSPVVSMRLEANGHVWPIAKLGPDHFVPVDAHSQIPACDGVIIMTVDGHERRWQVRIVNGVLPFDDDVKILHRECKQSRISLPKIAQAILREDVAARNR